MTVSVPITASCQPSNVLLRHHLRKAHTTAKQILKPYEKRKHRTTELKPLLQPKQVVAAPAGSGDESALRATTDVQPGVAGTPATHTLVLRAEDNDPFTHFEHELIEHDKQLRTYRPTRYVNELLTDVTNTADSTDKLSKRIFKPLRARAARNIQPVKQVHIPHPSASTLSAPQVNTLIDAEIDSWLHTHQRILKPTLSDSTRIKAQTLFSMLDTDHSQTIDIDELKHAITALGLHTTLDEVRVRIVDMDRNHSGNISFDEFATSYDKLQSWDDISHVLDYRLQRQKLNISTHNNSVDLPLTLVIPAFHRLSMIDSVMQNKHTFVQHSASTGDRLHTQASVASVADAVQAAASLTSSASKPKRKQVMYAHDPMIRACQNNHWNDVLALINNINVAGATNESRKRYVNRLDKAGSCALIHAAWHNATDCARVLLQHGAAVDATNNRMNTALHLAAQRHCREYCKLLIEHNASLTAKNWQNLTPMDIVSLGDYTAQQATEFKQFLQTCYSEYLNAKHQQSIDHAEQKENTDASTADSNTVSPDILFQYSEFDESQMAVNSQLFASTAYTLSHQYQIQQINAQLHTEQPIEHVDVNQVKSALREQLDQHSLSELFAKTMATLAQKRANTQCNTDSTNAVVSEPTSDTQRRSSTIQIEPAVESDTSVTV